jgi:hypothetical protein
MLGSATIGDRGVAGSGVPDPAAETSHSSLGAVKVTMNLPESCVQNIKWLAERLSVPNSHVVRRAVDLRCRIQKEIDAGAKILIERDGEIMTIWFD